MTQMFYTPEEMIALKKKGTSDPQEKNLVALGDQYYGDTSYAPDPTGLAVLGGLAGAGAGGLLGYGVGSMTDTSAGFRGGLTGAGIVGGGVALGILGHMLGKQAKNKYNQHRKAWNAA